MRGLSQQSGDLNRTDKGPRSVLLMPLVLEKQRCPDSHSFTHVPLCHCGTIRRRVEVLYQVALGCLPVLQFKV